MNIENMDIKELRGLLVQVKSQIVKVRTSNKVQKQLDLQKKKEERALRKAARIEKLQQKLLKLQGPSARKREIRKPGPVKVTKYNELTT